MPNEYIDIIVTQTPTYIDITPNDPVYIDIVDGNSTSSGIQSITGTTGEIDVDNTDPLNPVISIDPAFSGGGLLEERVLNTSATTTYTISAPGKTTADISFITIAGFTLFGGVDYTITNSTTITFPGSIVGSNLSIYYGTSGVYNPGGITPPSPPNIYSNINSLAAFSYVEGSGPSSESITFPVYATNISSNGLITPPAGFEIYNGSTWQDTPVTVNATGGNILTASIYKARLKAGLTPNSYSGNVVLSGTGATSFNIAVNGSVSSLSVNVQASGGDITYIGGRKIHKFDSLGEMQEAFQLWNRPVGISLRRLLCAGGGGGGFGNGGAGGGGGAVYEQFDWAPDPGIYTATIGDKGRGDTSELAGTKGGDTIFAGITRYGGGKGNLAGVEEDPTILNGGNGAGGARGQGPGIGSQGYNGTPGLIYAGIYYTTGAGAGAGGAPVYDPAVNGTGGDGYLSDISGINAYYGPGAGGGQTDGDGGIGLGGLGGGGNGGIAGGAPATSGTVYGAAGGGGANSIGGDNAGGNGYQGCVYVSYPWTGPEVDYGYTYEVLTNTLPFSLRDSALMTTINSGSKLFLGGGWDVDSILQKNFKTTTDGVNYTSIPDAPFIGDHICTMYRPDGLLWLWGNKNDGTMFVRTLNTTTFEWTSIIENYAPPQQFAFWSFGFNDKLHIVIRNPDNNGVTGGHYDVYQSNNGISWSYLYTLPMTWVENANCYLYNGKLRFGGGCRYDYPLNHQEDNNMNIWESSDGLNWSIVGTIKEQMKGAWPKLLQHNGIEYYFAGFHYQQTTMQGRLFIRFANQAEWADLGFSYNIQRHAISASIFNNKLYHCFGNFSGINEMFRVSRIGM